MNDMHYFLILHYSLSKWFRKKNLVIKQHLIHLETVKLRVFAHECERFGSEISLAPLAAAAVDEPKMRGFPQIWILFLNLVICHALLIS